LTDDDDRRAITAAMQRLFGGTPLRSSDKLDIVSLAQEAGAKRNNLTHKHTDLKDLFYAQRRTRDGVPDSSFDGFRQSQSDRHVGAGADRGADDGVPVERRSATDQGFRPRSRCGARDRFGGGCAEAVDGGQGVGDHPCAPRGDPHTPRRSRCPTITGAEASVVLVAISAFQPSIQHQVAQASPDYLAESRAASTERARTIAELTEVHEATLSSILGTLRSNDLDDRRSRITASETASAALIALRSAGAADRAHSEEAVTTAFARLQGELGPCYVTATSTSTSTTSTHPPTAVRSLVRWRTRRGRWSAPSCWPSPPNRC